jgi:predicted nucleotidyltransferase
MRINLNDTISGIPVRNVRKMLKKSHVLCVDNVMENLGIDENHATALIAELISRELIQPHTVMAHHSETSYWKTTLSGNAFAIAKAGKPIRRKSAEKIFAKFMDRVREVTTSPYYLYKVKTVVVFGSYLSDSSTVNDIDIALEIVPKESDTERFGELLDQRRDLLLQQGKHPKNIVEYVSLPEIEVYRFLKSRSRALSLHSISDKTWRTSKHLVVFQD